jgi:hypothetical protein
MSSACTAAFLPVNLIAVDGGWRCLGCQWIRQKHG